MRLLKSIFLFTLLLTFSSCGDDDDTDECQISDWVGTYTGTSNECLTVGEPEDVTITVAQDGSFIMVTAVGANGGELSVGYTINGCTATAAGLGGTGTLDGNSVTFTLDPDCTLTGTK
jgi:hypothetical protein